MKHLLVILAVASMAFAGCDAGTRDGDDDAVTPATTTDTGTGTDTGTATDTGTGAATATPASTP